MTTAGVPFSVTCEAATEFILLKMLAVVLVIGYTLLWSSPRLGAFMLTVYMGFGLHFHVTIMGHAPDLQIVLFASSFLVLILESMAPTNSMSSTGQPPRNNSAPRCSSFKPSQAILSFSGTDSCAKCYALRKSWNRETLRELYTREKGQWYKRINDELNALASGGHASDELKLSTLLLANALFHEYIPFPGLPTRVWRGVAVDNAQALANAYAAVQDTDELIYFYGFTSTSRSRNVALGFAGGDGILFDIELVRNQRDCVADMRNTTEYKEEQEILISCNAGFGVCGVDMSSHPITVRLLLADESSCPRLLTTNHQCQEHK